MTIDDPFEPSLMKRHREMMEKYQRDQDALWQNSTALRAIDDYARRGSISETMAAMTRFDDSMSLSAVHPHSVIDPYNVTTSQWLRAEEERIRALTFVEMATPRLDIAALTGFTTHANATRLLANPLHDATRLGLDALSLQPAVTAALAARQGYEDLYRLPSLVETTKLLQETLAVQSAADRYGIELSAGALTTSMQAMQSPWMHPDHAFLSVRSFTEIYAIGESLRVSNPFEDGISAALRTSIGDWRTVTALPDAIFVEPSARTSFYQELGFDLSIADFTAPAFDEATALAGLGLEIEGESDDEEDADVLRSERATRQFQRFERRFRKWLNTMMTATYGPNWIKHRVPGALVQAWKESREKEVRAGLPQRELLEYADWGDYITILVRNDNWNDIFKPIFTRQEAVKESFTRIIPVRHCVMHSRLVTQADDLYARVEIHRILRAIERIV
ncbi:Swt1 family HEPN domain-containing protein [Pseudorhodoplanes sp.]|uniref:Swt1 family HEPN domain-containing protein n=1 Tax=Pseudorhodoplanes sp. TaxID=1934341 RepID=UPI002B8F316C|nr:Swt1 family HEPN domain-containing protein [Pseudorhodoplanes sp.]HWV55071.1 Swt1 family HEPN domain-containing protein [Pseudorhodoplanes sp.]